MRHILYLAAFLVIFSCSSDGPQKVVGKIQFGEYELFPPLGYWYFPRTYPGHFESLEDLYLLSFFKNKKVFETNTPDIDNPFFNVGVTKNIYSDFNEYYLEANKHHLKYNELSSTFNDLSNFKEWSCKHPVLDQQYGIECISLRGELVTLAINGENEFQVTEDIQLFYNMLKSFNQLK